MNTATVVHTNNTDLTCRFPGQAGIASLPVDGDGHFEYRYVRRDNCGQPFEMVTQDPGTGAVRKSSGFVRARGRARRPRHRAPRPGLRRGHRSRPGQPARDRRQGRRCERLRSAIGRPGGDRRPGPLPHRRHHRRPLERQGGERHRPRARAGRIDRAGTRLLGRRGARRRLGAGRRHRAKLEGGVESTVPGVGVVFRIDPAPIATPVGYVKTGAGRPLPVRRDARGRRSSSATSLDTGETASTPLFTVAAGDDLQGKDLLVVAQARGRDGHRGGRRSGCRAAPLRPRRSWRSGRAEPSPPMTALPIRPASQVKPGQSQSLTASLVRPQARRRTTFL